MTTPYGYSASGKLLLSGEYTVLQGALAVAIPTSYGQKLTYDKSETSTHQWKSVDHLRLTWFSGEFDLEWNPLNFSDKTIARRLSQYLKAAHKLSTVNLPPLKIATTLEFPRDWGLGSSSSLIFLISRLFQVDPMELFFTSSSGSGYDVACAGVDKPITYQLRNGVPLWEEVKLPEAYNEAVFVHLNQKQDSAAEVERFNKKPVSQKAVDTISEISRQMLKCRTVGELQDLMVVHENQMSELLGVPPIKDQLFRDFNGSIKSLGAWGGDFVMALGKKSTAYFKSRGFQTVVPFDVMVAG